MQTRVVANRETESLPSAVDRIVANRRALLSLHFRAPRLAQPKQS